MDVFSCHLRPAPCRVAAFTLKAYFRPRSAMSLESSALLAVFDPGLDADERFSARLSVLWTCSPHRLCVNFI